MQMSFRWFGAGDPVRLAHVRQIPGVGGVVSALHDLGPGVAWPRDRVERLRDEIADAELRFAVVESIPVHEDIKLGRPTRDRLIAAWCESVAAVGAAGVPVVCYNFMPVFDWWRTDLALPLGDGSTALAYDDAALAGADLARGSGDLPGWAASYSGDQLQALAAAYCAVDAEQLWDHLAYFLERVVPAAEAAGVVLALHPDDPPWPIFGLPRIITDATALCRLITLVDRPANGVTFCTGSLGALPFNDLASMVTQLAGRIHFVHARNVRVTGDRQFHESAHPSRFGTVDLRAVFAALHATGFRGPVRPDHGRAIWGEDAGAEYRPGYGLFDRALGATYLQGLWEGIGGDLTP